MGGADHPNLLVQGSSSVLCTCIEGLHDGMAEVGARTRLVSTRLVARSKDPSFSILTNCDLAIPLSKETERALRCANLVNAWQETFRPMPSLMVPWRMEQIHYHDAGLPFHVCRQGDPREALDEALDATMLVLRVGNAHTGGALGK